MWDCPFCTFASPHLSTSLSLLLVGMNVTSLNPWFSDFHTAQFSDSSGWYLFCSLIVIFAVAVQGGKLCLSTPPSWPVISSFFSFKLFFAYITLLLFLPSSHFYCPATLSYISHVHIISHVNVQLCKYTHTSTQLGVGGLPFCFRKMKTYCLGYSQSISASTSEAQLLYSYKRNIWTCNTFISHLFLWILN